MAALASQTVLAALTVLASLGLACPVQAEPREVVVGKMSLTFDTARWTLSDVSPNGALLTPSDPLDLRRSRVALLRSPLACPDLARIQLPDSIYEIPAAAPDTIASRRAERYSAHTHCRNATPRGELLCVPTAAGTYALVASIGSCRAATSFGRGDPFEEFFGTVRFLQ